MSFELIPPDRPKRRDKDELQDFLAGCRRNSLIESKSLENSAPDYIAGQQLRTAINVAFSCGRPLLLTGEPGTGKTQAAYYIAHHLSAEVFRLQCRSDSTFRDLVYDINLVGYFAQANHSRPPPNTEGDHTKTDNTNSFPSMTSFLIEKALIQALHEGKRKNIPQVLLIDEIDKAPRDFPNDLLAELDEMKFFVPELRQKEFVGLEWDFEPKHRPFVVITSNEERKLPDAFLRRCIYHNIQISKDLILAIARKKFPSHSSELDSGLIELAAECFLKLRDISLEKQASSDEFLIWLELLILDPSSVSKLQSSPLDDLPNFLEIFVKSPMDLKKIKQHLHDL